MGAIVLYAGYTRLKGEWAEARGERFDLKGSVIYAFALTGVVFGLTRNFWLAVVAYCLSLAFRTVSMPLITTWINQNTDSSVRATVLSMDEQFFSLGETIGGPAVGAVGSLISLPAALVTTGLVRLPVAIIFMRFLFQRKPASESGGE